jgi:hypothetical protein
MEFAVNCDYMEEDANSEQKKPGLVWPLVFAAIVTGLYCRELVNYAGEDFMFFLLAGAGALGVVLISPPEYRRWLYLFIIVSVPVIMLYEKPSMFCSEFADQPGYYYGNVACESDLRADASTLVENLETQALASFVLGNGMVKPENKLRFLNASLQLQWGGVMAIGGYLAMKIVFLLFFFLFSEKEYEKNISPEALSKVSHQSGLTNEFLEQLLSYDFARFDEQDRLILDSKFGLEKIWYWLTLLSLAGTVFGLFAISEDEVVGIGAIMIFLTLAIFGAILGRITNNYYFFDFEKKEIYYHTSFGLLPTKTRLVTDFNNIEKLSVDHTYRKRRRSDLLDWVEYWLFIHLKNQSKPVKIIEARFYSGRDEIYKAGDDIALIATDLSASFDRSFDLENDCDRYGDDALKNPKAQELLARRSKQR